VEVGALAEWRRGRNFVAGEGFSFAEGADRGVSQVVPLRLHADWVHRLQGSVLALRAMVSIGLPILGATAVDGAAADAQFVTLLLQAQAARRFDELLGLEAIVRADAQISNDALLPIEQFSIGGHSTVRGYRENTAVRDNGWAATLEARLPILGNPDGTPILQLAPFVDAGRVWDSKNRTQFSARDLVSVGLGLRWSPKDWLRTEVYWGRGLMDSEEPIESSLQDHGVYFRITAGAL
jgi:hemolysin activation/secretion protein